MVIALAVAVGACSATSDPTTTTAITTTTQTTSIDNVGTSLAAPIGDGAPRDLARLQSIADETQGALIHVSDPDGVATVVSGVGDTGRVIEPDDPFFIGSGSKMITAVAILQLVDQGLMSLDDLLADHVDFDVATPITIRHLLRHTSGLGDSFTIYETCNPDEVMEGLAALAVSPYNLEPGAGAKYSTNGFNMLSLVMSSATGQGAAEVVRRGVFDPLGMRSSFFTGAEEGPALVVGQESWDPDCGAHRMDIGTGGGFASSAADLDTFLRALFEGDLLSDESLAEMTTVGSNVNGIDYGLGIGVLYPPDGEDQPMLGHWGTFGWDAGALYDPQDHRTIVVLVRGQHFREVLWAAAAWAEGDPPTALAP